MSGHDIHCPRCGSIDVCQDYINLRPVKTYGWVCDHCGHTWDVRVVTDESGGWQVSDLKAGDERHLALRLWLTMRGILAVTPTKRWQIRMLRAWWALMGIGVERELALRWLPDRYRLMVAMPEGDEHEWSRSINGKRIPIYNRRQGELLKAGFLHTHPGCTARLEKLALAEVVKTFGTEGESGQDA